MSKIGKIQVNSDRLMPIIKKWLYSDKDIFLRELMSNACDAIAKFKQLVNLGEAHADNDDYKIIVLTDKENKKLIIEDNGIGMTADEVEKYITQVAYSGATEFLEKYKNATTDGIIGHFGLGFFSAFMVADTVEIDTLSYVDGAKAVHWVSDGNEEYTLEDGAKATRGTRITLNLSDDEKQFAEDYEISNLLRKYCAFMPCDIYLNPDFNAAAKAEENAVNESKAKDKHEDGCECDECKEHKNDTTSKKPESPKPINNKSPLYIKDPKECTDEEYEQFFKDTFMEFEKPLFWIHLNVDYPFKLKGILYFPKQKQIIDKLEGQVKLYCNQVYIADNIKEVIPEFLMMLKGVIDCPDIPLNVSRSFLQNDREVAKISKHITKKVADKLNSLFNTDKDKLISTWHDISPFVKYGCIKSDDFFGMVKDVILYKTINDEYKTMNELLPEGKGDLYYVSDTVAQAQYIKMFKDNDLSAIIMDHFIDQTFISFYEYREHDIKFKRIDSETPDALKTEKSDVDEKAIIDLFKANIDKPYEVKANSLKDESVMAIVTLTEESRRMADFAKMYNMPDMGGKEEYICTLNLNNNVIKSLDKVAADDLKLVCNYILQLSMMTNRPLKADEFSSFALMSSQLLAKLVK